MSVTPVDLMMLAGVILWLLFVAMNLVVIVSIIAALLLRRTGLICGALAWLLVPACPQIMEFVPGQFPRLEVLSSIQLLQLSAALHVVGQFGFTLAYFSGIAINGIFRKLIRSNVLIAMLAALAALVVDQPTVFVLYFMSSMVVLLTVVLVAVLSVGRGAWFLLVELALTLQLALLLAVYAVDPITLPPQLIGLFIPVTVVLGPLLSSLAIAVLLFDEVASTRARKAYLREQLVSQQAELRLALKEAFLANESKYRFLASVSHDLRQPMYAINLYISTLFKKIERLRAHPERQSDWHRVNDGLRDLEGSARHLNIMFEALLDLSRLASGSVKANVASVHLDNLLNRLEADYSQQASEQGLDFRLRVPPGMAKVVVQTDPVFLERVLRNLLVNAMRYTNSGGVGLSLVIRGENIEFRVVDTGPGIKRELHERIFEEFYQVPGTRTVQESAVGQNAREDDAPTRESRIGLGLAISSRLAESLGTCIRIKSMVGKGTVFYFRQRMRFVMRSEPSTAAVRPVGVVKQALSRKLYTVIVDDEPEILKSTKLLLETYMNFEVFTAASGEDAIMTLGKQGRKPDFIISDFGLPGIDGLATIETLREEFLENIPGLLITGDTRQTSVSRFQECGLKVLIKPVTGPDLIKAIEEVMQSFRQT
jgi:signal transduction histidine kinase/CheY-like chemotaxis protein